ncbi:beta-fructofuranosidase-like protein [Leishmania tarentolae]|uniref:Beta-fructofuranosidase-like protein n=1 Tax=Leishmania tarentolae TaxID=5689 RepID=A0A640KSJ5_LEITA|nr:beta-fructofuranosidase-like protein [Leishmania tarentolae]
MENKINAARAAWQKVIIIGHTPPQPDGMYWKSMYQSAYTNLLSNNKGIITQQLFGHGHAFATLGDEEMGVPLIAMNALSPVHANQPAYPIGDLYTTTRKLKTLRQRYVQPAPLFTGIVVRREPLLLTSLIFPMSPQFMRQ